MKLILNELQVETLLTLLLEFNDVDGFMEYYMNKTYEVFMDIKSKKKITFDVIQPGPYKRALLEFMKYGHFIRFPESQILDWKMLALENIALLGILTEIQGHSSNFPYDEFYDVFNIPEKKQNNNWEEAYNFLDKKYKIDKYLPLFSNGGWFLSDFGLEPLNKLAVKLIKQQSPEEIIVTLNMIMDVAHQRSDIAELFIEGGSKTLSQISNG